MKNNNFKKVLLAAAIAATVFGPKVEKVFATETTSSSLSYYDAYINLEKTINEAIKLKSSYKYINARDFHQEALDRQIIKSKAVLEKSALSILNDATKLNLIKSAGDLKLAMDALDGEKASIKELNELVNANAEFVKSFAFTAATKAQREDYLKAYNKAYDFVVLNDSNDNINKVLADSYYKDLKDKKEVITKAYAPFENKVLLKEEIAISAKLRNDASKYTKKSFDSFLSALRIAETSVEDKATTKTAVEYKELTDALKSARLALVENKVEDEKVKLQRKRLEKSLEENRIAVKAAKLLLDITPEKVKPVKAELVKLIKNSEALAVKAEEALKKLDGIKG
ncbi:hypothetical protein K8P03_05510 [Anaerococcus murdochii]|uniref:Uncharacterized protein n=1 Tax=Anaerococcus murdochii TaxID=411577 RepID=A0ABS7SYW9_9FIRM|nr:hypothetical protein [Anaerococcus murdochii]MBZ2386735.1 hypothetical protein [Anaerococcus murdochii]